MTIKISEVLMAAKDRLMFGNWGKDAWHQRVQEDGFLWEGGSLQDVPVEFDAKDIFCMEGAIASAAMMATGEKLDFIGEWGESEACKLNAKTQRTFLAANSLYVHSSIANWNDELDRTEEEALEALDKAIAYAKEQEDGTVLRDH